MTRIPKSTLLRFTEGVQDVETNPDTDAGVRKVERRPDERSEMEIEEIDHVPMQNAVDEISNNASA